MAQPPRNDASAPGEGIQSIQLTSSKSVAATAQDVKIAALPLEGLAKVNPQAASPTIEPSAEVTTLSDDVQSTAGPKEPKANLNPALLFELATKYISSFAVSNSEDDLSKAILTFKSILDLPVPSSTDSDDYESFIAVRAQAAAALTPTLFKKYELSGDVADLSHVISHLQNSLPLFEQLDTMEYAHFVAQLGRLYSRRHDRLHHGEDLDEAINWAQASINLDREHHHFTTSSPSAPSAPDNTASDTSETVADHAPCLRVNQLTVLLANRAFQNGSLDDLNRAIENDERALQDMHPQDEHRLEITRTLSQSLSRRFERTGDFVDVSRAITEAQRALEDARASGREEWFERYGHGLLRAVVLCLWGRFEKRGVAKDLSRGIETMEEILRIAPRGDAPPTSDSSTASTSSRDREEYGRRLMEMGIFLSTRFLLEGREADINRAISCGEEALDILAKVDPQGSTFQWAFANLATIYGRKYKASNDVADLDKAITLTEIHLKDNPHPTWHNNIADLISTKYDRTRDSRTLDEAIEHRRRAVELTPPGHPSRTDRLRKLGVLLRKRFERSAPGKQNPSDIMSSVEYFSTAARDPHGIPFHRLHSACLWALTSRRYSRNRAAALRPFGYSVSLLAGLTTLGETPRERYKNLGNQSDWLALAAAVALTEGEVGLAIEWLEQGRCLVWSQISRLRIPADVVKQKDEALGERFERLSRQLEGGSASGVDEGGISTSMKPESTGVEEEVRRRHEVSKEWDQVVSDIRKLEGLEGFLLPIKADGVVDGLARGKVDGVVVMFNLHDSRCDALVLQPNAGAKHVPLKDFTLEKATSLLKTLRDALQAGGVRMRGTDVGRGLSWEADEEDKEAPISHVLGELWILVVRPILDALEYFAPPEDPSKRPRVWWCPTGPLAFLPIHAAGFYGEDSFPGTCTHDYVVSSYTPTVSVLLQKLQAHSAKSRTHPPKVLLVSQPDTPGLSPIPGTAAEVETLQTELSKAGIDSVVLSQSGATTSSVTAAMKTHSWAHFACHAIQDMEDPLKSGVHLDDGRLEFVELMGEGLPETEHAFLSACQTCTGDEKLSDEAVHLAAGMLAAGYNGVVATMWSINDGYGPEVAFDFYQYAMNERDEVNEAGEAGSKGLWLDCRSSAKALDNAIQKLKGRVGSGELGLLAWVPYAHFGV